MGDMENCNVVARDHVRDTAHPVGYTRTVRRTAAISAGVPPSRTL